MRPLPAETPRTRARIADWAGRRGLALTESGLLPPHTPVLRNGRGIGTQRAHILDETGPADMESITPTNDRRPERASENICEGVLPGGLRGTVAHHVHLIHRPRSGVDRWLALTDTVVVAGLPGATRAVCRLDAAEAPPSPSAVAIVSLRDPSDDPTTTIVAHPVTEELRDGFLWRLEPAEPARTLDAIAGPEMLEALREAPWGTRIEVDYGVLCVSVGRTVDDATELDALCRVATAVADGIRQVAARQEELDPDVALASPPETPRARWIDAGVDTVAWREPPPSAEQAAAAYAPVAAGAGRRAGRIAGGIALVLGVGASLAWVALWLALAAWFGASPPIALVMGAGGVIALLVVSVRAAGSASGGTSHDHVVARARPWGMEAFAREYARSRGLRMEDVDAFRHRFDAPLPGRPIKAFHGDLGDGVRGHLAIWQDPTSPGRQRHWLLAVVRAPSALPSVAPGYVAELRSGALVVAREVAESDRSLAALDALAAAVRPLIAVECGATR
jgi:hypothetical protein